MKPQDIEFIYEDEEIKESIEKIVSRVTEVGRGIHGVKGEEEGRKVEYEELLRKYGEVRGGGLYYPYVSSGIGNGPFVRLLDGSVKYDFINGIGVHYFGHSHEGVIRENLKAAMMDTVMQGNLQQGVEGLEFSELALELANRKGGRLAHCFLTTSGVMAGENGLKLAFQKKYPASRVLAFKNCFAGRTLAFSQITDKARYRQGLPGILGVDYVPFYDPKRSAESIEEAVRVLKEHLKRYPKQHAGMIFELVLGEGGYYEGNREFHEKLMQVCKENGVGVLVDEVQTFGRTWEPFAFQHYGLDAYVDVAWIGKSTQVCATLFTGEYKPQAGLLSQTFTASTSALRTGMYLLREFKKGELWGSGGKNAWVEGEFRREFKEMEERHKGIIEGPYGVGSMVGFTPLGGKYERVEGFVKELFKNGVIGFIAGGDPGRVRFLPPVGVLEERHIKEVCRIVEGTLLGMKG